MNSINVLVPLQVSQTRNSSNPTVSSITLQWTAVSGHSPSLRYNVEWNPSGATGSNISVAETSATIDGLNASTRYSFTVTAVNDGGSADPSESSMFSTREFVEACLDMFIELFIVNSFDFE